jgi:hypothetical protein
MRIISSTEVQDLQFLIIEVNHPIAVNHCTHRFQVILNKDGNKIFPKNKDKFLEFEKNDYIYHLESNTTGKRIKINEVLFHELLLCDKSLEECTTLIENMLRDTKQMTALYDIDYNEKQYN